jgi:hypothetical protein
LEVGHEGIDVEGGVGEAVFGDGERAVVLGDEVLRRGRDGSDDDFGVDRVTGDDFLLGCGAEEAEVAGVEEVVVVVAVGDIVAEEEGLYDAADAGFLEAFEEVVEVDGAVFDDALYGVVDAGEGDGGGVVAVEDFVDDFACDGVDEPGLALCLLVDVVNGIKLEDLSGFGGVLGVEGGDFVAGEVLEGHGLGDDVEGAGGAEGLAFGADAVFVVAEVTEADEGDGVWEGEAGGAVNVAVAELCDEGDEEGFGEAVGFIEEENEGTVKMSAEAREGTLEDVTVAVEVGVLQEGFAVRDIGVFHGIIHGMEEVVGAFFGVGEIAEDFEGAV